MKKEGKLDGMKSHDYFCITPVLNQLIMLSGVRDDRTPGGLHKSRYRRYRDDEPDSMDSQYDLETSIQTLINCDPYISPSFVTTEGQLDLLTLIPCPSCC